MHCDTITSIILMNPMMALSFPRISLRLWLFGVVACIALFASALSAHADDRYYVGTGNSWATDANWHATDKACDGAGTAPAPTSDDTVYFKTCATSVTIPAATMITNLVLDTGYSGTVTLGGTPVIVTGNVTINAGTLADGGYVLAVGGDWVNASTFTTSGTARFNGSSAQTINSGGTGAGKTFSTIQVDNTSGVSLITNHVSTTTVNISSGGAILDLVGQNLTVSGVLTNNSTLKLQGGNTVSAGTFTSGSSSTVLYNGTGTYASVAPLGTYRDLTFNGSGGSWTFNAALDVNGALTVTNGTVVLGGASDVDGNFTISNNATLSSSNYQMNIGGNWSVGSSGTFTSGTGTVVFDGSMSQSIDAASTDAAHDFQGVTISNISSSVEVISGGLDIDGTFTIGSGSELKAGGFTLNAGTLVNNGTLIFLGNEESVIGTMDVDSGTVKYLGTTGTNSRTNLVGGDAYYNLLFDAGDDSFTIDAELDVNGSLTLTSGTLALGSYGADIAGNFTRGGTFTAGTSTVTFSGSGTHTVAGTTTFYNLTKTGSGTLSLTAGQTFTISGTFTSTGTGSALNSTSGGTAANFTTGARTVDSLTVTDINNTGPTIRCYPSCINGGGNTGWLFTAASTVVTGGSSALSTLAVTAPNGGSTLTGGQEAMITWQASGSGITSIALEYSKDGGNTYTTIATGEANDGSYVWLVPNVAASMAKVQVKAYADSAMIMSDISDANFAIAASASATTPTATEQSVGTGATIVQMVKQDGGTVHLAAGGLFRGVTLSGVYRVNADGTRSVFPNEAAFMSYEKDFSKVVTVGDDQLRKLPLGKRVTMNVGALVKIQSDPKVYAVGEGAKLTWIPSEAEAKLQFGADWAKKVKDVSDAFWFDYTR